MAVGSELVLRQRFCRANTCGKVFWICRQCDRGQRYCSPRCRTETFRQQHRAANRRYQGSPEGRKDHSDRQRNYRRRRAWPDGKKSVTDEGSTPLLARVSMPLPASMPGLAATAWNRTLTSATPDLARQRYGRVKLLLCIVCGRQGRFINPFPGSRRK
jgi:hypothetical protein